MKYTNVAGRIYLEAFGNLRIELVILLMASFGFVCGLLVGRLL